MCPAPGITTLEGTGLRVGTQPHCSPRGHEPVNSGGPSSSQGPAFSLAHPGCTREGPGQYGRAPARPPPHPGRSIPSGRRADAPLCPGSAAHPLCLPGWWPRTLLQEASARLLDLTQRALGPARGSSPRPLGGTRTPAQQGLQVKPPELLPAPTVLNPGVVLWKHRTTGRSWDGFQPAGYGLLPGLRQAVVCPLGQKLLEVCVCAPGFAIKWAFGLMCHRIEHSVGLPAPTGGSGHDHRCLGTLVVTG